MAKYDASGGKDRKKTPDKWNQPKNPNDDKGAGENLNFWAFKDRSGNSLMFNHQEGSENISIEHRSGAKMQLMPDGSMHIKAQKGRYTMVFGEDRMEITGAHDVTVKGAASLRMDGDYNVTVAKEGKANFTFEGDFNVKSKNFNVVTGGVSIAAKNLTMKTEGDSSITSQGSLTMMAEQGASVGSTKDALQLGGKTGIGMNSDKELVFNGKSKISMTSEGAIAMESSGGAVGIKGSTDISLAAGSQLGLKGGSDITQKAAEIKLNSGDPKDPEKPSLITQVPTQKAPPKVETPKNTPPTAVA